MWDVKEIEKYLEDEQVSEVESEQLYLCRSICQLLNDDYTLEVRNETFQPGKSVLPVPSVKQGDLVLIGLRRVPTRAEFEETLTRAKSDTHLKNMHKAYARGEKTHYDKAVGSALRNLLVRDGYLGINGIAKVAATVQDIKDALGKSLDRHLDRNYPARDDIALKLTAKDAASMFFARPQTLADVSFCLKLMDANPALNIESIPEVVRNDWRFIHALFARDAGFANPATYFDEAVTKLIIQASQNGVLMEYIDYERAKKELAITEEKLRAKLST